MNRAVLLLLFVIAGCTREEAVQAIIQLDPALKASCVFLEVHTPEGKVVESKPLLRPEDQELRVVVIGRDLPPDVQLQARALWGAAGCEEPLFFNGRSEPVAVHFEPGSQDVTLFLPPPSAAEDEDRDGFVASELGGADCDDKESRRQPQAQEVCDASDDLNCNGQRGCEDSTCSDKTCSRAPTSLVFNLPELTTIAGVCSTQVLVERREADGTPSREGFPTPITLASTFGPGVTFHSDPACTSSPPSSIAAGKSSLTFFVRSTTVGTGELRASSSALPRQATLAHHTLLPGSATKVALASPNTTSQAGDCAPVSLEWRDAFDNPTTGTLSKLSLSISPTPANTAEAALYQDAACTQALNLGAQLPAVSSLYFRATRATTYTLEAKLNGTSPPVQEARSVKPLPASKLTLSPSAGQTLMAGECSAPVNVRITDKYDNLSPLPSGQLLTLSTTPATSFEAFWGAGCDGSRKLSTSFDPRGNTEGPVSFKIKTGGPVELKLSGTAVGEAKQNHTIVPVVRRGSCPMNEGETTKSCSLSSTANTSEPLTLAHSFLVFQATTTSDQVSAAFVRCWLSATHIICKRNTARAPANIDWQVVELHQGLFVQHHPDFACTLGTARLATAVDLSSSFVLFSSSQDGEAVDSNDFPSVKLSGSGSNIDLSAAVATGCNSNQAFSLQVVQFTGSQVQRNITGAMPSNSRTLVVTGLPTTDFNRSIVLSTWQVNTDGQDIYKRMVRGEIDQSNTTQLLFRRGDGIAPTTADIPQISWERITFPTGTRVQTHVLRVNDNAASTSATLATPVDATRTLLLTSSQAGGQGAGETSYGVNDVLGVATGRLSLSGNQLSVTRDVPNGSTSWTAYAIQFDP